MQSSGETVAVADHYTLVAGVSNKEDLGKAAGVQ